MKPIILVIDEAQLERKMNEWALTHAGYDVLTAQTGGQGLRLARERSPALILLDPLLPDMSGHQLLGELKNHRRTAQIPVIILSSTSRGAAVRLPEEGAAEYLEKERAFEGSGQLLLSTVANLLNAVP